MPDFVVRSQAGCKDHLSALLAASEGTPAGNVHQMARSKNPLATASRATPNNNICCDLVIYFSEISFNAAPSGEKQPGGR
jgi:hypothetical protein